MGLDCGIAFSFFLFLFLFFSSSFLFSIRFSFFDINQTDRLLDQLTLFVTANSIQFLQIATSARRVTSALREDALLPNINPIAPSSSSTPHQISNLPLFIYFLRTAFEHFEHYIYPSIHLQRDCGFGFNFNCILKSEE